MRIHTYAKKSAAWNKSGRNFWQRRLQMCVLEIITSTSGGGRALFAALCRKGRRIYLCAAFVYLFIFIWLFNAPLARIFFTSATAKFPPFCAQLCLLSEWNLKDQITDEMRQETLFFPSLHQVDLRYQTNWRQFSFFWHPVWTIPATSQTKDIAKAKLAMKIYINSGISLFRTL